MRWMGSVTMKSSGYCRRVSEDFMSDRDGCSSPDPSSSKDLITDRSKSVELELAPLWGDQAPGNNNTASSGQNGRPLRVGILGKTSLKSASANYKDKCRRIRTASYNFLERPSGWKSVSYHALLLFLIIASLIVSVISSVQHPSVNRKVVSLLMFTLEVILLIIFIMEYIVRMWSAGCRSCYVGWKGRLKFALKPFTILDLVVIIASLVVLSLAWPDMVHQHSISDPAYLLYIQEQPYIYLLLRFLQLVRMLRIDRQGGSWKLLGSVIYIHRQELLTTLYLGFCILVSASFILFLAERGQDQTQYDSFAKALWWGIVTLTTIGYGDTVPKSWYGKLCASCFMLMGISLFALPAGILGSGFALKVTQQQRQKHFHRRRRPAAVLLQSYWRMYCAECDSASVASWLPSIYYNRGQILKVGTVPSGATESPLHSYTSPQVQHKRRTSRFNNWRAESRMASRTGESKMSKSDSVATAGAPTSRKDSIQTLSLDSDFFGEAAIMENEEKHGAPLISLSNAQKHAIRLIRLLKLKVAARKFKEARKPYDVKDVMEQYSTGHVEMLARVKNLQFKLDKVLGVRSDMGILLVDDENIGQKSHILGRLTKVESQVSLVDQKLDVVLDMLRRSQMFPRPATHAQSLDFPPGDQGSNQSVHRTYSDPHSYSRSEDRASTSQDSGDDFRVPYVTLTGPETSGAHGRGFSRSCSLPHQKASSEYESLYSPHSQSYSGQGGHHMGSPDHVDDRFAKPDRVKLVTISPLSVSPMERARDMQFRQLSDVTEGDESQADSKENILSSSPDEQSQSAAQTVPSQSEKLRPDVPDSGVWERRDDFPGRQGRPSGDADSSLGASALYSDMEPLEGASMEVPKDPKRMSPVLAPHDQEEDAYGSDSVTSLQSSGDFSNDSADSKGRPFSLKRKPLIRHSNVDSGDVIDV